MGGMSYQYFYPLLDDFMTYQAIDKPRLLRMWTWDDSTRIANMMIRSNPSDRTMMTQSS